MKKYFGESAYYSEGDEHDKLAAKQYLEFWKRNLLFKLSRDSYELEVIDEQWSERPSYLNGMLCHNANLGLKVCVKAKFKFELE